MVTELDSKRMKGNDSLCLSCKSGQIVGSNVAKKQQQEKEEEFVGKCGKTGIHGKLTLCVALALFLIDNVPVVTSIYILNIPQKPLLNKKQLSIYSIY